MIDGWLQFTRWNIMRCLTGVEAPTGPGITVIQEDELGFAAVDGKILPREGSTSITGYSGTGFADGDAGIGKSISWSVAAETAGTYSLAWRYAFGGDAANLPGPPTPSRMAPWQSV